MEKRRGSHRNLVGKPGGKSALVRPRLKWRIILRWMFRQWNVGALTGLIWLGIGTGGKLL